MSEHTVGAADDPHQQRPRLADDIAAREALCEALRVLEEAEDRHQPALQAQALSQVGRCYRGLSRPSEAQWYLNRALPWAEMLPAVDFAAELRCDLAEVAADLAERAAHDDEPRKAHLARERARDHCFAAASVARRAADPDWEVSVLIRAAAVLDRCGDHDDAIALQQRALRCITRPDSGPITAAAPLALM